MGLETEPFRSNKEIKVAKITRSLSQDVGWYFKNITLKKIFPKKIIINKKTGQREDIGEITRDWLYDIVTCFIVEKKYYDEAVKALVLCYSKGININYIPVFKALILERFIPTFTKKINDFSQISKLSLMAGLEKPKKIDKFKEGDDIQW
jgi:hypothetical protein